MKRKQFLLWGAAGMAAVAVPTYWYYFTDADYDPALARPESLSLIWEDSAIRDIGKKYRALPLGESRQRALVNRLNQEVGDSKTIAARLEQKINEDFEKGETVIIDGWILAKTEARQCALYSITPEKK
jgi:hypothetical protein